MAVQASPSTSPSVQGHAHAVPMEMVVVGSSHVRRLSFFIAKHSLTNFTLPIQNAHVYCIGLSGMYVLHKDDNRTLSKQMVQANSIHPHYILIHAGSNDLDKNVFPIQEIVEEIFKQAFTSLRLSARHVFISQQWFRKRSDTYNDRVLLFNELVRQKCQSCPHISIWHHDGFWYPPQGKFSFLLPDNIHLTEQGNKKFFKSVRQLALSNCRHTFD